MLLATEGLSKTYRRRDVEVAALDDVSLSVEEGAFATVTGPSGSGKTTLLLTLAGLLRPSAGRIRFRDRSLEGLSDAKWAAFRRENLGFVMQNFSLVPYLMAAENVALPSPSVDLGRRTASARGGPLDRVGGRAPHLPRELSGGQQQRVAIARALAAAPALLLADEPTGNLDPALSRDVIGLLRSLNRDEKLSILMVTHSPEAAAAGGVPPRPGASSDRGNRAPTRADRVPA
jgi:putative ABC transport system ATP-binding protein